MKNFDCMVLLLFIARAIIWFVHVQGNKCGCSGEIMILDSIRIVIYNFNHVMSIDNLNPKK